MTYSCGQPRRPFPCTSPAAAAPAQRDREHRKRPRSPPDVSAWEARTSVPPARRSPTVPAPAPTAEGPREEVQPTARHPRRRRPSSASGDAPVRETSGRTSVPPTALRRRHRSSSASGGEAPAPVRETGSVHRSRGHRPILASRGTPAAAASGLAAIGLGSPAAAPEVSASTPVLAELLWQRPARELCIIDRSTSIANAEAELHRAILITVVGTRPSVFAQEALKAVAEEFALSPATLRIARSAPEDFILLLPDNATADLVLRAGGGIRTPWISLHLKRWSRQAHARSQLRLGNPSSRLGNLHGGHLHGGHPSSRLGNLHGEAAPCPYCCVEAMHPNTSGRVDMARFNLTAWTSVPECIPRNKDLLILELFDHDAPATKLAMVYDVDLDITGIEEPRSPSYMPLGSPRSADGAPNSAAEDGSKSDCQPRTRRQRSRGGRHQRRRGCSGAPVGTARTMTRGQCTCRVTVGADARAVPLVGGSWGAVAPLPEAEAVSGTPAIEAPPLAASGDRVASPAVEATTDAPSLAVSGGRSASPAEELAGVEAPPTFALDHRTPVLAGGSSAHVSGLDVGFASEKMELAFDPSGDQFKSPAPVSSVPVDRHPEVDPLAVPPRLASMAWLPTGNRLAAAAACLGRRPASLFQRRVDWRGGGPASPQTVSQEWALAQSAVADPTPSAQTSTDAGGPFVCGSGAFADQVFAVTGGLSAVPPVMHVGPAQATTAVPATDVGPRLAEVSSSAAQTGGGTVANPLAAQGVPGAGVQTYRQCHASSSTAQTHGGPLRRSARITKNARLSAATATKRAQDNLMRKLEILGE
ncbi:hypothetical protein C2845_PM08G07180 [Panicum miliaceum]|uniref:Uncharacterized protein n=1 Tax=Panicum miliaceum TaxID=4540 RepID=A0A3L6R2A4_PANMI|nr:hypothetical protein C2845_PM08G07180 [Panicum miliaceum]